MKHYHIVDNNSKTNINKIVYTHLIVKLYRLYIMTEHWR